jgi:hypothetical protein
VIRAATCHEGMPGTGACLPMPAFGVVADAAMQAVIGRYAFDDPR